eukprot:scaffold76586_cov35-Prasinocladus_malaysianus.AAC.1
MMIDDTECDNTGSINDSNGKNGNDDDYAGGDRNDDDDFNAIKIDYIDVYMIYSNSDDGDDDGDDDDDDRWG